MESALVTQLTPSCHNKKQNIDMADTFMHSWWQSSIPQQLRCFSDLTLFSPVPSTHPLVTQRSTTRQIHQWAQQQVQLCQKWDYDCYITCQQCNETQTSERQDCNDSRSTTTIIKDINAPKLLQFIPYVYIDRPPLTTLVAVVMVTIIQQTVANKIGSFQSNQSIPK